MPHEEANDDNALLGELSAALAAFDAPPENVTDAAKACFTWLNVDEELAELVTDSALQTSLATRSLLDGSEPRLLTFTGPNLTVEVEVTALDGDRRLVGQLVPPGPAHVEVRWPDGHLTSEADSIGFFSADSVPAGPVSIACRRAETPSAAPVVTSWVTI